MVRGKAFRACAPDWFGIAKNQSYSMFSFLRSFRRLRSSNHSAVLLVCVVDDRLRGPDVAVYDRVHGDSFLRHTRDAHARDIQADQ
jgi:hypothetical protein